MYRPYEKSIGRARYVIMLQLLVSGGQPWDRQPVSGKLRRKPGVSPGFATYRGPPPPKPVKHPRGRGGGRLCSHQGKVPCVISTNGPGHLEPVAGGLRWG